MNQLKTILLIALLLGGCGVKGQKVTYKHNYIDGWIKTTESAWVTVSMKGDTTWFTQTIEETDQDDPNVKYVFDGLGNIVKPDTVIKTVPAKLGKPIVSYASVTSVDEYSTFSEPQYKDRVITKTVLKPVYKKGKTIYRNRYKHTRSIKYVPVYRQPKQKKEPKYETIKIIDYKKRLWIVRGLYGSNAMIAVVDAGTEKQAIVKFKKRYSVKYDKIQIDQFFQYDIIK